MLVTGTRRAFHGQNPSVIVSAIHELQSNGDCHRWQSQFLIRRYFLHCKVAFDIIWTVEDLASRLRLARLQRGLGVNELTRKAGLGGGQVSSIENGRRSKQVAAETIRALAQALEVRYEWLATGHGVMESGADSRLVELDDRYHSRPRAAQAARLLGYSEEAIARVLAWKLDSEVDPGERWFFEQIVALDGQLKAKISPVELVLEHEEHDETRPTLPPTSHK
jgi:transcriptional regulator with XRE-family HTH domain